MRVAAGLFERLYTVRKRHLAEASRENGPMVFVESELTILDGIPRSPYQNKSSQKILLVLSKFSNPPFAYRLIDLARELRMSKNMVHRALTTLVQEGYLVRDQTGRQYQLGYKALEFRDQEPIEFDIRQLCRPYLERLYELTGESLFLSIIVGRSRVNIDGIQAVGPRVSHVQRAKPDPLHRLKMSRLLLAYLTEPELENYLRVTSPLNAHPETPDASEPELRDDLKQIRADGCVIWHGSSAFSAVYISFPVLDQINRPHASITIGGPLERFSMERVEKLRPKIMAIAQELNRESSLYAAPSVWFGDTTSQLVQR